MSYGECDICEHYLTTEEYNAARVLRPTAQEPILCFKCIRKIIAENKRLKEEKEQKCKWAYDDDYDYWETKCGELFTLLEGTPKDNKMKHCPYCGKLIQQVLFR